MSEHLQIWVVYDHPRDFPDCFVARRWDGELPTDELETAATLDELRCRFEQQGFVCLQRMPQDDAAIVETWL